MHGIVVVHGQVFILDNENNLLKCEPRFSPEYQDPYLFLSLNEDNEENPSDIYDHLHIILERLQ